MSSVTNNTNFTFEYAVSIVVTLIVCSIAIQRSPKMNTFVVILLGLVVSYITLLIVNFIFPNINRFFNNLWNYITYMFMNNFNNTGYIHVWPPVLAVLIIFIVLLYTKNLG